MMTRHDRMVAEVKRLALDRINASDKTMSGATFSLAMRMVETIHAWKNRGSDTIVHKLREVLAPAFSEYGWTTFDCNPEFVGFKTGLKCALMEDNADSGKRKMAINNRNEIEIND